jgi:hypothetical protein
MSDPKYKVFAALDPFFDIVRRGLAGHVEGDHYFDTIADNAIFEYRYIVPGWPQRLDGTMCTVGLSEPAQPTTIDSFRSSLS